MKRVTIELIHKKKGEKRNWLVRTHVVKYVTTKQKRLYSCMLISHTYQPSAFTLLGSLEVRTAFSTLWNNCPHRKSSHPESHSS